MCIHNVQTHLQREGVFMCGGEMNGASLPGGGEVMRRDGISLVERIQQRSG